MKHPKMGFYWQVSARSVRWGLNERKTFNNEKDAEKYARQIQAKIVENGKQPTLPTEKIQSARSYEKILEKLSPYGRTPEEAADHFLIHLGNDIAKQQKPCVRELVGQWKEFKYADATLSHKTVIEIRSYARFITNKWGELKPDDLKRNDIDLVLKKLKVSNNTRRK